MPNMKNSGVFPPEAIDHETMIQIIDNVKMNGINILRSEISF